jgi:adenosylcobyric acid synthase
VRFAPGLDLLPCKTVLTAEKTTVVRHGATTRGTTLSGYEIHMGKTTSEQQLPPFVRFENGDTDGVRTNGVIGTYLHGVFEHPAVCAEIFGVEAAPEPAKTEHYERLADWFARHVRNQSALGIL